MRNLMNTTAPINAVKSTRPDIWRGLTSVGPGVINPIAFIPLLREDRLRARLTVQVKSEETVKVIVNPVRVRVNAYLIPKTVLARFGGSLEVLNRSYQNEPAPVGLGTTPKYFLQGPALPAGDTGHALYDVLGVHWADGARYNTDLVESYNQLVNWQRKEVSPALPERALDDATLAQAMWDAWRFDHIKPSFDVSMMEAAIPVDTNAPARVVAGPSQSVGGIPGIAQGAALTTKAQVSSDVTQLALTVTDVDGTVAPMIIESELGASVSLANIKLAQQTQAFAMMRDRYKGVPEEYLIDLLMAGIAVPADQLRQPILLASGEAVIGQTERYATDGTSLDVSVANGMAALSMTINTPAINPGGMVIVTCDIVPEQLYERVADPALNYIDGGIGDVSTPEYLSDYLDPQKVNPVLNQYVDVRHSDPSGIFGYAPLNYLWRRSYARVGGKYKRPVPDAFSEDRQRIWSIEKADPALSSDWYLCPSPFPKSVFADTDADPYEVICVVEGDIVGNTVFGPYFDEDMGSWDKVMAEVDQTRLPGTPVSVVEDAQLVEGTDDAS